MKQHVCVRVCVCVYQLMAASILLEARVNEVTHIAVSHVTCFTHTLTLETHRHIYSQTAE